MKIFEREQMLKEQGHEEEAKQIACNLFKNGVSFEIVKNSVTTLSEEELKAIYDEVKNFTV